MLKRAKTVVALLGDFFDHSHCQRGRGLKSISASQVFREYPELKKYLRKQAFGEYRYLSRTVGDAVTVAVAQHDIRYHQHEEHDQATKGHL